MLPVIVPLRKLPLNPNGKIDKPALPFPDTAQLAAAARHRRLKKGADGEHATEPEGSVLTPIQQELRDIWQSLLPHAGARVELDDNFFDLGGHSILATRMIFEVRKKFVVEIALGAIFKSPTLKGLAGEIERLKGTGELSIQALAGGETDGASSDRQLAGQEPEYAADARELAKTDLATSYPPALSHLSSLSKDGGATVFLTGATGFLGAYLLRDLLIRQSPQVEKVIVHVRAKTVEQGLQRVIKSCEAYGVWDASWTSRIETVTGELGAPKLGLDDETWKRMEQEVDVIIHNGAQVHWIYPYSKLRPANVIGTIDLIRLCENGKPKSFAFVSSTSVLDSEHYVQLSDSIIQSGGVGVPESDDLEGSSQELTTGYGQSKWAGEYIVREAGKRGLTGCVIRPGYITGDSKTGVTNTDDFLIRMIKGCVQLGQIPAIHNTVNMVPVDHVARVVAACAFFPPGTGDASVVAHVTSHPRLRFTGFLGTLSTYNYPVSTADYIPWRIALEKHITTPSATIDGKEEQNALFPLLHFVLDNLPQSTKAPELDDSNTTEALRRDGEWTQEDRSGGMGVSVETMGIYLGYLVTLGFLPAPPPLEEEGVRLDGQERVRLPHVEIGESQRKGLSEVGGRGALV